LELLIELPELEPDGVTVLEPETDEEGIEIEYAEEEEEEARVEGEVRIDTLSGIFGAPRTALSGPEPVAGKNSTRWTL
jgi:hypothetical protein